MELLVWNASDNAGRGMSKGLWRTCPLMSYMFGVGGTFLFDDFMNMPQLATGGTDIAHGYMAILDTSCTAKPSPDQPCGVFELTTTATAADFAFLTMGHNVGGLARISDTIAQNKKVWFETRFKLSVVANTSLFVGMLQAGQMASSTLDTGFVDAKACLGMLKLSGGTGSSIIMNDSAGAEVVVSNNFLTPAADTWYKYGFYYDGEACYQYLNGAIVLPDTAPSSAPYNGLKPATANFPDAIWMTPVWGMYTADAATKKLSIDFVALAVES